MAGNAPLRAGTADLRILLCSAWAPWGSSSGYQMRLTMAAEALSRLGVLQVCLLDTQRSSDLEEVWPDYVDDAEWCPVEAESNWPTRVLRGQVSPVREARLTPAGAAGLRSRFLSRDIDLTWCVEARGFEPVAELVPRPLVLDLHNVHSALALHKRKVLVSKPWDRQLWDLEHGAPYLPGLERRWLAWEREVASRCDRVVVCSEADRRYLEVSGVSNTATVPNCYRRPASPAGDGPRAAGPLRVGFIGVMDYQPNSDGVEWFVRRILPTIQDLEPDATLTVIGRAGVEADRLAKVAGVRVTGFVPNLDSVLSGVDVLVAPLRFGGGTRFKVLEAFAHHLPMVATTVGAEGIDAVDGEHLLVRDDPAAFGEAVVGLYRDRRLRQRLVAAAARLYEERYTWERGLDAVTAVASELLATRSSRRDRANS